MSPKKQIYTPPTLESHPNYVVLTGISLPIGISGLDQQMDFLENSDFMETEEQ